jgi:hypothetical protein
MGSNQEHEKNDPNRKPAGYDRYGNPYYTPTEAWHVVQEKRTRTPEDLEAEVKMLRLDGQKVSVKDGQIVEDEDS